MKRTLSIILTICLMLSVLSTGLFSITASAATTYTITYHLDGGTNALKNPDVYTTEDTITLMDATKEGYDFAGWFLNSQMTEQISEISDLQGNLNLYAKFTPKSYTATFQDGVILTVQADGFETKQHYIPYGTTVDPYSKEFMSDYLSESQNSILPDDDPCFSGWYIVDKYGAKTKLGGSFTMTSDTTIYCNFSFDNKEDVPRYAGSYGGVISLSSLSVDLDLSYKFVRVPTLSTGEFSVKCFLTLGYSSSHASVSVYNLTKDEKVKSLSISYGEYGETYSGSRELYSANPGDILSIYTTAPSAEVVLIISQRESVEVTSSKTYNKTVYYDQAVSLPTPTPKKGYDFIGWYDEQGNKMTDTWTYTEDKTFTAKWQPTNCDINYVLDGGTNNTANPSTYTIEDAITLESPSKKGYSFEGWYSDADFTTKVTSISKETGDITLYAKWKVNSYNLTLDANEGVFAPKVTFISDGVEIKTTYLFEGDSLTAYRPDGKNGYIFAGWYTDDSFNTLFNFNGTITDDITLYAKWLKCDSNIVNVETTENIDVTIQGKTEQLYAFVPLVDGQITVTSESDNLDLYGVLYDSSKNVLISADDISSSDLDFSYSYDVKAGQLYYIAVKGNMSLTSGKANINIQWSGDCTIVGTTYPSREIEIVYDTDYKLPEKPVRDGYVFFGWFDENGDEVTGGTWNFDTNKTLTANWGTIISIDVTTKPDKLTYLIGDAFDETGMVVTAYYSNGISHIITDYTISGYSSTPGTKTIVVSYGDCSASFDVTVEDGFKIKSVSHEALDDKVIFTVTTTPNFNRIKVTTADNLSSYIAYTNNYTVDDSGNYVFTISVPAVVGTTDYAFDGRRADTNKYAKDYFYHTAEVEEETPAIISVSHTTSAEKIIFTVVTKPGDFGRIKVTTADNLGSSLGVASTYTVNEDGNYVWTVKATEPSENTSYAFDLRSGATSKYLKEYFYYEVEAATPKIISATHTISEGKIIFTVVTKPDNFSRMKVTTTDNLGGSLGVASTYTVNAEGNYVWTIKATEPSESTSYAFDLRNATTSKYLKEYFYYEVEAATPTILSVSHTVSNGKISFTVITKPGDFSRIKVTTADSLGGSIAVGTTYTVDANGNYVWTIKAPAPTSNTNYAFDLRSSETGKYIKDYSYYACDITTA